MLPAPVSGAIGGLAGTVLMTLFEYPFWKKWGMSGVLEWQVNRAIVHQIIGKGPAGEKSDDLGSAIVAHMLHGVAAGIIFVLILPLFEKLPLASLLVLEAVAYSFVLWLIFSVGLKSLFDAAGVRTTTQGLMVALLSHGVYGLTLGLTLVVFGVQ